MPLYESSVSIESDTLGSGEVVQLHLSFCGECADVGSKMARREEERERREERGDTF